MNEKLRKIINHYGMDKQLKYFQSEVFELNEAIIKRRNTGVIDFANDYRCSNLPLNEFFQDESCKKYWRYKK